MNIIRLYNQNRKQLFILILIVAFIISTIHLVNYLVKKDNQENLNNNGESSSSTSSTTTTYNPNQSAISSSSVSNSVFEKQADVIDKFMEYCNVGDTVSAYNLLSNDCKEVLFPTLEYFINNYYKPIFTESKLYSIKNWTGSIYKIDITTNILATGKSNNGISIEDYFTIVNEENKYKININGFIRREKLDKIASKENIQIEVLYKDVYMDNIICTIKAKNNTNRIILLDSGENTQNMYIMDSNNVKYTSYRNEIPNAELKVLPYSENKLEIKYASSYIQDRQINYLAFNDIILDYNTYNSYILKGNYSDRASIKVEL